MRRSVKITLPYTLCLFAAISTLGLVVMLTMAALAYEDGLAAEEIRAHTRLSRALDRYNRDLRDQLNPSIQQIRIAQRWAESGQLDIENMDQWAALLLAPLADRDAVVDIAVLTETRPLWHVTRSDGGWAGQWMGPSTGSIRLGHWNADALPMTPRGLAPKVDDAGLRYMLDNPPLALAPRKVEVVIHSAEAENGVEQVYLVGRLSGHVPSDTILVVAIQPQLVRAPAAKAFPDVAIIADPGGLRMSQLADSHTRTLLESQAVPDRASLALRKLFPAPGNETQNNWYAAQSVDVLNGYPWWSVATMVQKPLAAFSAPIRRYALGGVFIGLVGALIVAVWMGRRVSKPLAQIARRANSIYDVDEHYLPWPKSRFSEVNSLTTALESLYESAVEHLDYHDAPLVVFAEQEALSGDDGIVDAHPLKRHINLRQGQEAEDGPEATPGPVINVEGSPERQLAVPAAQLQVLHGARREVKRLQGQLAGSQQALRSADVHFQQSERRLKRHRAALRSLDKQLQADHAVRVPALETIREGLAAKIVSLWRPLGGENASYTLRGSTETRPDTTPLASSLLLRALLQEEFVASTRDIAEDPRFQTFQLHPEWGHRRASLMIAPLKFRGNVLGFLLAEHDQVGMAWKGDEEAFLASCAVQCTMALAYKQDHNVNKDSAPAMPAAHSESVHLGRHHEVGEVIRWETDLAGCLKLVEGDVKAIYGYDGAALIGQPVTFLTEADQGTADLHQLRRVLRGEPCVGYETSHQRADGLPVVLTIRAEIRRDAAGRIVGVRGTATMATVPVV